MGDARLELEDASDPAPTGAPATRISVSVLAASVLVAAVVGLLLGRQTGSTAAGNVTGGRFSLELAPGTRLSLRWAVSVATSPDGDTIAFVAEAEDGLRRLYVRDITSFEPRRIEGTESAASPFFSPDGEWVGYFNVSTREIEESARRRWDADHDLPNGRVTARCELGWRTASSISTTTLLSASYRVPASGGEPEMLTEPEPDAGEKTHRFPEGSSGRYKTKYRVTNWREYERGLRSRGDITVWFKIVIPPRRGAVASGCAEGTWAQAECDPRDDLQSRAPRLAAGVTVSPTGRGRESFLQVQADARRQPSRVRLGIAEEGGKDRVQRIEPDG